MNKKVRVTVKPHLLFRVCMSLCMHLYTCMVYVKYTVNVMYMTQMSLKSNIEILVGHFNYM